MPPRRFITMVIVGLLLIISVACGTSIEDTSDIVPPAAKTAEQAARGAGIAAQTAAAQAGDLSGTAAALATTEGSKLIATAKAAATPHVDSIKEKIASIEPDADGNYRVTLSEDEVNTVLRLRQILTGDVLGAAIQSQEVEFRDGSMTLSGTIIEPLPGQLRVKMRPIVVEGRLQLNIEEASVADKEALPQAIEAAEGAITGSLGAALEYLPVGVQLQQIIVANGELTIIGHKTESE